MKNKTNNSTKTTATSTTKVSMYKTTNGIQKLPNGNYRVRKTVKGVKYSLNFTKRTDAMKYVALINTAKTV